MRFTTKTEYGLVCLVHLTRNADQGRLTIKELAQKESYPAAYIEKILQALRQAGVVAGNQGSGGGYELAKKPSEITLRQVVDALEGNTFDVFCQPQTREDIVCTHFCLCGIKPVWRMTKKILDDFYDSITLETLAKNEMEVQSLLMEQSFRPKVLV